MQAIKIGGRVFTTGLILWFLTVMYFAMTGDPLLPPLKLEIALEVTSEVLMKIGVIVYLWNILELYEYSVKRMKDKKQSDRDFVDRILRKISEEEKEGEEDDTGS